MATTEEYRTAIATSNTLTIPEQVYLMERFDTNGSLREVARRRGLNVSEARRREMAMMRKLREEKGI